MEATIDTGLSPTITGDTMKPLRLLVLLGTVCLALSFSACRTDNTPNPNGRAATEG